MSGKSIFNFVLTTALTPIVVTVSQQLALRAKLHQINPPVASFFSPTSRGQTTWRAGDPARCFGQGTRPFWATSKGHRAHPGARQPVHPGLQTLMPGGQLPNASERPKEVS